MVNSAYKISESTNKKPQSLLIIANNNTKPTTTTLDLNITRRPLKPIHNLNPNKANATKTNQEPKPNILTKQNKNKADTKEKGTQPKPTTIKTKPSTQTTVQKESENFDNIDESELPTIGDVSSSTATQPKKTCPSQKQTNPKRI